jgi:hypothetical protein
MSEMTTTEITISKTDTGYFINSEKSSFVAGIHLHAMPDTDKMLVVVAMKDGSIYAYTGENLTYPNILASLFSSENLSIGKWVNAFIKKDNNCLKVVGADSTLRSKVRDRFVAV